MSSPNYEKIYDSVFSSHKGYLTPAGSPGLKIAKRHEALLKKAGKRHLDIGCGAGFVLSLSATSFSKKTFGADVSPAAIRIAQKRSPTSDIRLIKDEILPFEDQSMDIITCFDVLEHLDEADIRKLQSEIDRVSSPNALVIASISLRPSRSNDINGENLHRTVKDATWWNDVFSFTSYTFDILDKSLIGYRVTGTTKTLREYTLPGVVEEAVVPDVAEDGAAPASSKSEPTGILSLDREAISPK